MGCITVAPWPAGAREPADGYPLEAVLAAAKALCSAARTVQDVDRGPLPSGWKIATPREDSWLGTYLGANRRVAKGFRADPRALIAKIRGRSLEAIVSTVYGPPLQRESTSCEVVDRKAVLSPDDERIGRWAGRPPALGRRDVLPGLFGWMWKPGLEPASQESNVNYVTASAAQSAGLRSGLTYLAITLPRRPSK